MKSFRKWLRCFLTAEHWDPAIARDRDGVWRCKKCGTKVRM